MSFIPVNCLARASDRCYITDTPPSTGGGLFICCAQQTILYLSGLKQPFSFAYHFVGQEFRKNLAGVASAGGPRARTSSSKTAL